jgi:hypothetical protein
MQKDMLDILAREGFRVNERELTRVRLRNNWHLREPQKPGKKRRRAQKGQSKNKKPRRTTGGVIEQLGAAILGESSSSESESESEADAEGEQDTSAENEAAASPDSPEPESEPVDPELIRRREERLLRLQAESDARWRTRKRRRRTRGWAGLPPDDPSEPPRFPSETTIDESKAYLHLDNTLYRQVRQHFQTICQESGVIRKTAAGPEKWAEVKNRLVRENAHLADVFRNDEEALLANSQNPTPENKKALAVDVICMDVTKRLRTIGARMLIPQVKVVLALNPEQIRKVRSTFYEILRQNHITTKVEAGPERWEELKQTWIAESDLMANVIATGPADPEYDKKLKAIEALARDVLKRWRDDINKKNPIKQKQINNGPGPGPAPPTHKMQSADIQDSGGEHNPPGSSSPEQNTTSTGTHPPDLQIDPSLLLAANATSVMPTPHQHQHQHQPDPYVLAPTYYSATPIPVYFRLHRHSATTMQGKHLWLNILQSGTVAEIRTLAMREHPGTVVVKIEGLVLHRIPGQPGREILFTIDDDDELAGYLGHVAGGKATFVVLLAASGQQAQGYV